MAANKKQSKPIFRTEIPFTETRSPPIPVEDREVIVDLVCAFLEPLGTYRKTQITPSKGRKRKWSSKNAKQSEPEQPPPPPPELTNHILVGLNSVTRHLTDLAAHTAPSTLSASNADSTSTDEGSTSTSNENEQLRKLDILVIPHPAPHSSIPHAHLPTLLYLAHPPSSDSSARVKILCLPSQMESRLAAALHIPRVGAIGILEGAPGAETLVRYAREKVGELECPWIEEAMKGEWKGVKVSRVMNK